jgi:hypothetical protein
MWDRDAGPGIPVMVTGRSSVRVGEKFSNLPVGVLKPCCSYLRYRLFAAKCRSMSPEKAAAASGVEPDGIREAARLLWHHRPVARYTS